VAADAAHETGFPPKVVPWDPGSHRARSERDAPIADRGRPLAIAFPMTRMSGRTPYRPVANQSPVRPNPVWTSSTHST